MATADELTALSRRAEILLTGDDGSCFDGEGKERTKRLAAAVKSYTKTKNAKIWSPKPGNETHILCIWEKRYEWGNSGYGPDMSNYVAAYREPPRPFATDDALAMVLLEGYDWSIAKIGVRYACDILDPVTSKVRCKPLGEAVDVTLALAVTRAYLAAAEAK